MSDPDETRTITGWRTASRFYRRTPGLGWLLALLAIPLLLGLLGWGLLDKHKSVDVTLPSPTITAPDVTAPNVNVPSLSAAWAVLRNGNDVTVTGVVANEAAKTGLLDSLKGVFGSGVNLIDKVDVKADANAPDLSGLADVEKAALDIPDFGWKFDGDTVTLTGTAPSAEVRAAVETAAKTAWPNVKIDNQIQVVTATATTPAAPAPPAGACASLQSDISALLKTPINFDTDGFSLTPGSQQLVGQIAQKIAACPDVKVSVDGFTDNTGNDAINNPLSANRAKAVADSLVGQGVASDHVTSQGHGSANPVASNDTAEGKAQNRRVEITVS